MNYQNRNDNLEEGEEEGEEEMNTLEQEQGQHSNFDPYVHEIWQLFDKDNDDTIYLKDLLDLIKALGIGLNEDTKLIINDFIEKSNEKIPFQDFVDLYQALNEHKKSKEEEEQ